MHLIKPCWFCADVAQVSRTVLQNWKRADLRDGSGQDLPLFSQADRLQHSTGWVRGCTGLSLSSGDGAWGCVSSAAELMQGDYLNVLNMALRSGLNVGAHDSCQYL